MPKKPSARQIAADQARYDRHLLGEVASQILGVPDPEAAIRQLQCMFGQPPELVYHSKRDKEPHDG